MDSPPPYGSDAAPPPAAPSYDNPGGLSVFYDICTIFLYNFSAFFGFVLAPPPSYDSLYGKLKGAKQESTSFVDFAKKFILIILGTSKCTFCCLALTIIINLECDLVFGPQANVLTLNVSHVLIFAVGCTILVGLVLAIPIAMITIGNS